ncbi:calcium-binding protein [Geminicoccus roseus]|uniref:calcium-binding protein n=1 Tax=Geminicoccus roseus TaxID=404900 RepID=UPI000409C1F4|nr:calcium-binding protein [Geminicoccus roseus]
MPTITGTPGNDDLVGTSSKDTMYGRDGNDRLAGGMNDDALYGEAGHDMLHGQEGDDRLFGAAGNDILDGGIGDDLLFGNEGDDTLHGGDGQDVLRGRIGQDRLSGGPGDDQLFGNDGDDFLDGGEGNDQLWGGDGWDDLRGGLGDDLLHGGLGDDFLDAGGGTNVVAGEDGDDVVTAYAKDSIDTGSGDDRVSLLGLAGLDATVTFGAGADALTMDYSSGNQEFAGGGQTRITDFTTGSDLIGPLRFAIIDDGGLETVGFAALDSNADGVVGAGDAGVALADQTLTIDLGVALTSLASVGRPGFHVATPIVLQLDGVTELKPADFAA